MHQIVISDIEVLIPISTACLIVRYLVPVDELDKEMRVISSLTLTEERSTSQRLRSGQSPSVEMINRHSRVIYFPVND